MLTKWLIKHFVKPNQSPKKQLRRSYGYLGGTVGIIVNLLLFIVKLVIGLFVNSIAIIADAFNNLTDVGASFVTIFGFKLASKPPDKEHPYGHGRMEYLSALFVAILVILVGVEVLRGSIDRILTPTTLAFSLWAFLILLASILLKLWLYFFNRTLGLRIDSDALKASAMDALSDVVSSSVVVLAFLFSRFTSLPIDGYVGIVVSIAILYAGVDLIKKTIHPLLGAAPDKALVEAIQKRLLSYPYIEGVHDLMIHNYGPGRVMGSIHAEVPQDISIVTMHEIIDQAENELLEELDVFIVIHVDPVLSDDDEVVKGRAALEAVLSRFPEVINYHDFRIVKEGKMKRIIVDVVTDSSRTYSEEESKHLNQAITEGLKEHNVEYEALITIEYDFIGIHFEHTEEDK